MRSSTRKARPAKRAAPRLPPWRWALYAALGAAVFVFVYWGSNGPMTLDPQVLDRNPASRDAGFFGTLFGVLSMVMARLFLNPVFIGLAERRSKAALAKQLAVDVLQAGAEIAGGIVMDAVTGGSSGGSSSGSSGSGGPGGGGRSGGGGASGRY